MMIEERMERFIRRLCIRNLRSRRVMCCTDCPFEDEIVKRYPELARHFDEKRRRLLDREGL